MERAMKPHGGYAVLQLAQRETVLKRTVCCVPPLLVSAPNRRASLPPGVRRGTVHCTAAHDETVVGAELCRREAVQTGSLAAERGASTAPPPASPGPTAGRAAWIAQRSRARAGVRCFARPPGGSAEGDPVPSDGAGPAGYEETSGPVKALVLVLTNLVNGVLRREADEEMAGGGCGGPGEQPAEFPVEEVFRRIREDYEERNYLWTGDIASEIYAEECTFTDPTLSFKGLSTFQKNMANLRPVVNALVAENGTELRGIQLDEADNKVSATWRMYGTFKAPWRPKLDVLGRTEFTYDPSQGNRVVRYNEFWELSAKDALLQLVTPTKKDEGS